MLAIVQQRWTGLYLLLMAVGALLLFLYGFFPLKYHTGNFAHMDDLPNFIEGVSIDGQEVYNPGEHSVILMVIDGLRYDFVTGEYMPYTSQLLKNGSACLHVAVADPPTVTMPRIKAMMTGSVSTFADVALNFGAPAVTGDSVLRAARARGRRAVLLGDDTWLRLFPGLWSQADGTTSFFVSDYTEVDSNVTRHLDTILSLDSTNNTRFDFLVLHYLGLDHIGHLEGARSPKVRPKMAEMDDVVRRIVEGMAKWERAGVLFLCGDHGMRDAGGHGGASPAELLVPLLVAAPRLSCDESSLGPTVSQADLAPTIAWLLHAPIPGDSAGAVLPSLLPRDVRQSLYLRHYNAMLNIRAVEVQLGEAVKEKEYHKQYHRAARQFATYLGTGQRSAARLAAAHYDDALRASAAALAAAAARVDAAAAAAAALLLLALTAALGCLTLHSLGSTPPRRLLALGKRSHAGGWLAAGAVLAAVAAAQTLACHITETSSQLCSFTPLWTAVFFAVAAALTFAFFVVKTTVELGFDLSPLKGYNAIDCLLVAGTALHPWTFFGTSFIEEEHMTWYFLWNTLMFFVLVRTLVALVVYFSKRLSGATEVQDKPELARRAAAGAALVPQWVALIALHRYLRTMNQTGDRWLFLPDTSDWLRAPGREPFLHAHLVAGTLVTLLICLWNLKHTNNVMKINSFLTTLAAGLIFTYRIASEGLPAPVESMKTWDQVNIVSLFWAVLISMMAVEIVSYVGVFRNCGLRPDQRFVYQKPKVKTEDYGCELKVDEPSNLDQVKLNLARSLSYMMLNYLMLIVVLLMRPHNVVMVPSVYFTCVLTDRCLDPGLLSGSTARGSLGALRAALAHLWVGAVFFFYQGNSNSLASVDLSPGYVGLAAYCPARVALRTGAHAYAGPALAGAALYAALAARAAHWSEYRESVWRTANVFALQRALATAVYSLAAAVFRHHLFVWTVFSPKLLYDLAGAVFTAQALATVAQVALLTEVVGWLARARAAKAV